jgi:cold shock CspA family protein
MEPILKAHFNKFKQAFEIDTHSPNVEEVKKLESSAFEKFVNYLIFSLDYPDIFTGNIDLLDFVSVGGGHDTGIDGIGIKVNERLVRNIEEIEKIAESSKKVSVDFVFIQSKMKSNLEASEFNTFGIGVKHFFSDCVLPENDHIKDFRELKDFIYSNEKFISKLDTNPRLYLYYAGIGNQPTDAHFYGTKTILEKEFSEGNYYFEEVEINILDGKTLISFSKELENIFSVQLNIIDIFPLIVNAGDKVKKAYAFTCKANEFLKLLQKEDNTLRRSLFNDNVRDYLGNKGTVNSEIEYTISLEPEMFLLCNNGITIVCDDFEQVRDKLVRIENPQIVNGCQTSSSIFNLKNHPNIVNIQLIIRLICTDDLNISNKIVRGTNKQNQVLDEAFEATKPFHQELEEFFLAFEHNIKIYYERRSKQYNNDPLIKKTQIVNLRILTQVFVSMFLNEAHVAHRHEAKLLEEYGGENSELFNPNHDLFPYYICGLTWFMFDKYFRESKIPSKYISYKSHLYLIFRESLGEYTPRLNKSKAITTYCNKMISILTEPQFSSHVHEVLSVFDEAIEKWVADGNSFHGIKDRKDFTELLLRITKAKYLSLPLLTEAKDNLWLKGKILNIRIEQGRWYGFIKQFNNMENVYFDNRSFNDDIRKVKNNLEVEYQLAEGKRKLHALAVRLKT